MLVQALLALACSDYDFFCACSALDSLDNNPAAEWVVKNYKKN